MGFEKILFYIFGGILVIASAMVVTRRNSVHAALYLVLAFVTSAMLWMLLEAEFLAIVLVLVYVGAVMVLFLFVVMMLDVEVAAMRAQFIRYLPLGLLIAGIMLVEIFLVVGPDTFGLEQFAKPEALIDFIEAGSFTIIFVIALTFIHFVDFFGCKRIVAGNRL